ncbi:MAG TPA: plasmid pRiA4b ORF-3 family protein [Firmicutes bacterium]|nr:plasmid pRiA4b ORF-3 family protein [Bacillota bacterium]
MHIIKLRKVLPHYPMNYPTCIAAEGNRPPEDVCGEPGYDAFLESICDKSHPEHQEALEWGRSQGYEDFSIEGSTAG